MILLVHVGNTTKATVIMKLQRVTDPILPWFPRRHDGSVLAGHRLGRCEMTIASAASVTAESPSPSA
jgi:hypothetical protein